MDLVEIETSQWPVDFWWEVVNWCLTTFEGQSFGTGWYYTEDYKLFLSEENCTLLALRWSNG
jgi:hypothetical protein